VEHKSHIWDSTSIGVSRKFCKEFHHLCFYKDGEGGISAPGNEDERAQVFSAEGLSSAGTKKRCTLKNQLEGHEWRHPMFAGEIATVCVECGGEITG
jgi:hypothetical protein